MSQKTVAKADSFVVVCPLDSFRFAVSPFSVRVYYLYAELLVAAYPRPIICRLQCTFESEHTTVPRTQTHAHTNTNT